MEIAKYPKGSPRRRFPEAKILPEPARRRLTEAAAVYDEFERRKAIEEAIAYARFNYPQFFKPTQAPIIY